jgi:hypothetical protein
MKLRRIDGWQKIATVLGTHSTAPARRRALHRDAGWRGSGFNDTTIEDHERRR